MTLDPRGEFHRELDRLDIAVASLVGLFPEAVADATRSVLASDDQLGTRMDRWRTLVEDIYSDMSHTIEVVVARQAPVAGDLRFLLVCVRLVPALYDAVELVADIARGCGRGIGTGLSGAAATLLASLGDETAEAWRRVEELWGGRDATRRAAVDERVERSLSASAVLVGELGSGRVPLEAALPAAVVAHDLERIGLQARAAAALMAPVLRDPERS